MLGLLYYTCRHIDLIKDNKTLNLTFSILFCLVLLYDGYWGINRFKAKSKLITESNEAMATQICYAIARTKVLCGITGSIGIVLLLIFRKV